MNIFQTVKEAVTAKDAAMYYGIRVNRSNMACCPFHDDHHPSMKVDKGVYLLRLWGEKGCHHICVEALWLVSLRGGEEDCCRF
ncbi:MAG: hypothetical protein LUE92_05960 [Clostridiales bacterium]|nr:hypothetical protein [Clostridiales bacterium]